MMNRFEQTRPGSALGGEARHGPALAYSAFLARAARSDRPTKAWIHAAVVEVAYEPDGGIGFQLAADGGRSPRCVSAMLSPEVCGRLVEAIGCILPWPNLVGIELDLHVQGSGGLGGASLTIIDVDRHGLEAVAASWIRDNLQALAATGLLDRQRCLPEPATIRSVEVIHDPRDPVWSRVKERLDALAAEGVSYQARRSA
jgi:hypothetical protein